MSVLIENRTGAQILPRIGDQRANTSGWAAHLCADADLRARARVYAELAGRLSIHSETDRSTK